MNKNILKFLQQYSFRTEDINSLLVSTFIYMNNIEKVENDFITKYIFKENQDLIALQKFLEFFEGKSFDLEDLIELFEFVISPGDKIVNGAVYTPKYIRDYIVKSSIKEDTNLELATACDISCGCGGFLYDYALILHE